MYSSSAVNIDITRMNGRDVLQHMVRNSNRWLLKLTVKTSPSCIESQMRPVPPACCVFLFCSVVFARLPDSPLGPLLLHLMKFDFCPHFIASSESPGLKSPKHTASHAGLPILHRKLWTQSDRLENESGVFFYIKTRNVAWETICLVFERADTNVSLTYLHHLLMRQIQY